jgi:hypothetical protein
MSIMQLFELFGNLFGGVLPILIFGVLLIFWLDMIAECVARESKRDNDRVVWLIIIIWFNVVGALIYYFVRRPQRIKELGR